MFEVELTPRWHWIPKVSNHHGRCGDIRTNTIRITWIRWTFVWVTFR